MFSPRQRTSYDSGYTYGAKPHAPVRIGDRTFTYDANGNQTGWQDDKNHGQRVATWDEENRIDSLTDNGRTHLYSYDDAGERVIKDADRQGITAYVSQYFTVRNASLATKHVFVGTTRMASKLQGGLSYLRGKSGKPTHPAKPPKGGEPDPEPDPTGPGQGIAHRSEQGAAHAQNTLKNPHYADPSKPLTVEQENARIDDPAYADWEYAFPESYDVATLGGGAEHLYFYHADHLGSTGYVTRADALVIEHVQYFPFGETWVQQGGNTEKYPYLFTSKEFDEETGLYYFGARYYDPRTSVWQSADPILEKYLPYGDRSKPQDLSGIGGVFNLGNLNLYAYTHHNPLLYIDPDGRELAKTHFNFGSLAGHVTVKEGVECIFDTEFMPTLGDLIEAIVAEGYDVKITDAFRTNQMQLDEAKKNSKATKGISAHEAGFAVDMMVKKQGEGNDKYIEVGKVDKLAKIIREKGLRTGADFRDNYDPVHVDAARPNAQVGSNKNREEAAAKNQSDYAKRQDEIQRVKQDYRNFKE